MSDIIIAKLTFFQPRLESASAVNLESAFHATLGFQDFYTYQEYASLHTTAFVVIVRIHKYSIARSREDEAEYLLND